MPVVTDQPMPASYSIDLAGLASGFDHCTYILTQVKIKATADDPASQVELHIQNDSPGLPYTWDHRDVNSYNDYFILIPGKSYTLKFENGAGCNGNLNLNFKLRTN
jgi:hypothetical protein